MNVTSHIESATWRRAAFVPSVRYLLLAALAALLPTSASQATTLFSETFSGYTSFPSQIPSGDFVNTGIPQIGEGADEFWYAGRFETPDGGTIDSELAVQKVGGGTNGTHVGRFEDDAGLLFPVPAGNENLVLSFDWRTFLAESADRLVVGYFVGDLGFDTGANRYRDFINTDFGGNQSLAEQWWATQWVQLLRVSASNTWHHAEFVLPSDSALWVAFWLDNGEGDYAKIDNILVTSTVLIMPEPTSWVLLASGLILAFFIRRRA